MSALVCALGCVVSGVSCGWPFAFCCCVFVEVVREMVVKNVDHKKQMENNKAGRDIIRTELIQFKLG